MSKHTPGPWSFVEHNWSDTSIYGNCHTGESYLGTLSIKDEATEENQEELEREMRANARLIAAAPDMLEALEAAVESGMIPNSSASDGGASKYSEQVKIADQIRDAIAKATGQEESK